MSFRLHTENGCVALVEKKRCGRPITNLGHLCGRCWAALSPQSRSYLEWEAAWTVPQSESPKAPMVVATIMEEPKTLVERFEEFWEEWEATREPREVLRLRDDLARFEAET